MRWTNAPRRPPALPECLRFREQADCIALVERLLGGCPVAHGGLVLVIPRAAWFAVGVGGCA